AVRAAVALKPRVVIPMHRSKADPREFKNKVESSSKITALTLQIGETYQIS
ncbi:MAG: metal-dependent hydrolase, partial [Deltaproteobacteria bacterium]|nr:metal-dependent hydrolase [Deltaproteobacteria bacterium]